MEINLNNPEHQELLKFLRPILSFSAKREMHKRFLCKDSPAVDLEQLKAENKAVYGLVKDGISEPVRMLTSSEVDEVLEYFNTQKCIPGHVVESTGVNEGMSLNEALSCSNFASYSLEQVINAPHLLKAALSKEFLNVARLYLGPDPIFYSLGLFWAGPGTNINPINQAFHRDEDDYKFISLFVYLTDIDVDDDGPHIYLKGTHDSQKMEEYFSKTNCSKLDRLLLGFSSYLKGVIQNYQYLGYGNSFFPKINFHEFVMSHKLHPAYEKILRDLAIKVFAKRGEGFYADVGGYHKGEIPKSKPRLLFWARYGVSEACSTNLQNIDDIDFDSHGIKKEDLDQDVFRFLFK